MAQFLEKFIGLYIFDDEIFYKLNRSLRIKAFFALIMLNLSFILIIHLTLSPYLTEDYSILFWFFVAYLSFFIISILPFLTLFYIKLRRYKRALIGFLQISTIAGSYLLYELNSGKLAKVIFIEKPQVSLLILMIIILLMSTFAINQYTVIIRLISNENSRRENEFKIAQNIQANLVPTIDIVNDLYSVYGKTQNAFEVGGDIFDAVELPNNQLVLSIGDVSGHDIAAGLLMAISKGAFRTLLLNEQPINMMMNQLNKTIYENASRKMFLSFAAFKIDLNHSRFEFSNAGHLPALFYSAKTKTVEEINAIGIALGFNRHSQFERKTLDFEKGDIIVLVTDGFDETKNEIEEDFGTERIINLIKENAHLNPKDLAHKLFIEQEIFANTDVHHDDLTYLAIKFG